MSRRRYERILGLVALLCALALLVFAGRKTYEVHPAAGDTSPAAAVETALETDMVIYSTYSGVMRGDDGQLQARTVLSTTEEAGKQACLT